MPGSMLEEEISGLRVAASSVPGLHLGRPEAPPTGNPYAPPASPSAPPQGNPGPTNPYGQNPYAHGSGYYRPEYQAGPHVFDPAIQQEVTYAWVGGILGLLVCSPIAIWGLMCAKRAKEAGHPGAQAPYILNIVVLVIAVLGICGYAILMATVFGGGLG